MGNSQSSIETPKKSFQTNMASDYMNKHFPAVNLEQLIQSPHPYDDFVKSTYGIFFNENKGDEFKSMLENKCGAFVADFIYNICFNDENNTLERFLYNLKSIIEIVHSTNSGYILLLNIACKLNESKHDGEKIKTSLVDFKFIIEYAFKIISNRKNSWLKPIKSNDKILGAFVNYLEKQPQSSVTSSLQSSLPRLAKLATESFSNIFCGYSYHTQNYIPNVDLSKSKLLSSSLFALFYCSLPDCYVKSEETFDNDLDVANNNTWTLLYSSTIHGKSINRLKGCCFDYFAPTIMLVSVEDGSQFCMGIDCCWKNEPINWGGHMCFFNQILPIYDEIYRGENMMYFNIKSRSLSNGILIGGGPNSKTPLFSIDADLSSCKLEYKTYCSNKIVAIEVYGCNSNVALTQKHNFAKVKQKDLEKSQKVDSKVLWKDNVDRQLLELGGLNVSHSEHLDERK